MDFTRSDTHCSGDQDQQVNTVTAFLDGSVIYGTSEERAMKLRGGEKRRDGKLVGNAHLPHFLPREGFKKHCEGKIIKYLLLILFFF